MQVKISMDELEFSHSNFMPDEKFKRIARAELTTTVANVKKRLEAGKKADGSDMRRYSPSYEKAIDQAMQGPISRGPKKGRVRPLRKKGGNKTPNLRVTGKLWSAMSVKEIKGGAEARITGARATVAGYLVKIGFTGWFAFGQSDEKRILESFSRFMDDELKSKLKIKRRS